MNDSLKTREYLAMYQDDLKVKNYESALPYISWLLENNPQLYKKIYIDAVRVHHELAKNASDSEKLAFHQGEVIRIYKERIKYFGEANKVNNHLFYKAYSYYRTNPIQYEFLFDVFDSCLILNQDKVFDSNLLGYLDLLFMASKSGFISDPELLDRLLRVEPYFKDRTAIFSKYKALTQRIIKEAQFNCDLLSKSIGTEEYRQSEMITRMFLDSRCSDSDIYYESIQRIAQSKLSPKLYAHLAILDINKDRYVSARNNYKTAINYTVDSLEIAILYLSIAKLEFHQNRYGKAYSYANLALKYNSMTLAYDLLGDLFYNSYEGCRRNKDKVYDKLCFIIAYNYYEKANSQSKMIMAYDQFPTRETLFIYGYSAGDHMEYNCWIRKDVTLMEKHPGS